MQSNEEKGGLPAVPEQKPGFMKATKDFFGNALTQVKGKDLVQLVEEFSSEMTLVAEGLSEDQAKLHELYQSLSAQQTVDKDEAQADVTRVTEALKETSGRVQQTERLLESMRRDVDHLQKELERQQDAFAQYTKKAEEKKAKKLEGMSGILRQLTVLVAIGGGAWVIVTLLNLFK